MLGSMKPTLVIVLLGASFLALRVPVLYHQPGGQDEDCYAVPGLTILETGIPRMPHVPARNTESVYYRSDDALYSEPPLYFYWQALFYAMLPDRYGTARLASAVAGLLAAACLVLLGRGSNITSRAALWGAGLFIFSRWFYFPATSARPDILCTLFGFIAIYCMFRWRAVQQIRWLISAGVAIGLGGLAHPFALVYAVQLAVWGAWSARGWRRIVDPCVLGGISILVAALWIPLILIYPETFKVQFESQFLGPHSGGLLYRIVMPWESLQYHFLGPFGMFQHLSLWQAALAIVPAVICLFCSSQATFPLRTVCWLGLSSIYVMAVIVGPHHPVMGYWSYSAGLMFLCTGWCIEQVWLWFSAGDGAKSWQRSGIAWGASLLLVASLIPGSGLRTLYVTVKHWNDVNYRAPDFAVELMKELPSDAIYAVDTQFTLDFIVHDRKTLLAQTFPTFFCVDQCDFDYLIVSRYGIDTEIVSRLPVEFMYARGIKEDLFACYCEVYRVRK